MAVKYLYKYIYKGPDKAQIVFNQNDADNLSSGKTVSEINDYVDARYVSAIEGVWHIFHFLMHDQSPSVIRLDTHLEGQNMIVFHDENKISEIKDIEKLTKLTAWFKLNSEDKDANQHLYHDIPKYYVWKSDKRIRQ